MKQFYVDGNYRCHANYEEGMTLVEDEFFDGKCDAFIEGYCYDTSKGYVQIYPWKPYKVLDAAQKKYKKQLLADFESALTEIETALGV